jgi:hypothetical protein
MSLDPVHVGEIISYYDLLGEIVALVDCPITGWFIPAPHAIAIATQKASIGMYSLVPRPHPQKEERVWYTSSTFWGLLMWYF